MAIDKTNPFLATIQEKYALTGAGSTKETYHVSLNLKNSGLTFKVGDSIAVFPQNDPILVEHLLNAMKAKGDELITESRSNQTMTIRDFLSFKANLSRLNSSFLKLMYEYETYHDKKNHLHHLLDKDNRPLLTQYLTNHDPLDLLKEYQEVTAPLQEMCAQFGPLLPRFYSVASSLIASKDQVDLTVALFTFSHSGQQRFGVASHFLCHMAQVHVTPIPIYVQSAHGFTLPTDPDAPIIMIGPGTGVAPFRAFLQERIATRAQGKNWLFFGERNQKSDFFYEDFFSPLSASGKLRLDLAFSRDQSEKIYVQHRMYENAAELWKWIQDGSYLYVCGDMHRMAKDVDAMLQKIAREQGNLSEEEAKAYFKALRTQKKYLLDVY